MIRILLHHILVKLDDATEADETYRRAKALGIHLELDKREQQAVEYGSVIQFGPTAFKDLGGDPNLLSVGDRVTVARYSGKKVVDSDGTEYLLFNDSDVLAIIE